MNWDTGFGFRRLHQAKKLGLTQEALIGIAVARDFQPSARWGSWAKYLLDRSLLFFDRLAERAGRIPDPVFFDSYAVPQGWGSALLAAARVHANAARALDAGLASRDGGQPPPLYAYDPDIGRLAVTTPSYNTAIVAVNQGAFPYGGLDLARFYDGEQEVVANVGGRPPASFGLLIRDSRGRRVAASQLGRTQLGGSATPLRLVRAPQGVGATGRTSTRRAYSAPFSLIEAVGARDTGGYSLRVRHRFTAEAITTSWTARRPAGGAAHTVDVLFPSYGSGSRAVAVLRDGTRVGMRHRAMWLRDVAYLHIISEHSGYAVTPTSRTPGARIHLLHPRRQTSNPRPGPTVAVRLRDRRRFTTAHLAVRIAVARTAQQAVVVASKLA